MVFTEQVGANGAIRALSFSPAPESLTAPPRSGRQRHMDTALKTRVFILLTTIPGAESHS